MLNSAADFIHAGAGAATGSALGTSQANMNKREDAGIGLFLKWVGGKFQLGGSSPSNGLSTRDHSRGRQSIAAHGGSIGIHDRPVEIHPRVLDSHRSACE